MDELWLKGRSGSHAGRGFHYQDAVATELAVRAWHGELVVARLIPEGLEDVSLLRLTDASVLPPLWGLHAVSYLQ